MSYPVRTFEFATIVNVVDGDTCDILLDLGYSVKIKTRFRLASINTPERGQPGWQEATDFLRGFVGVPVIVQSTKLDKYGRFLAEIFIASPHDPISLNRMILNRGLAVLYMEKK